jgi:hypothetical protein
MLVVCCDDAAAEVSMSEHTALSQRVQQFIEMVESTEASLAYVERLIAWLEQELPAPQALPLEAERARPSLSA